MPLRCGAFFGAESHALSVSALLLLHLLQDRRRRRIRHQHHGRCEDAQDGGKRAIGVYRARIEDGDGYRYTSTVERNFCSKCATALWMYDPDWPGLVHPFASAIDTKLPKPPSKVHLMLRYKANWVEPDVGRGDKKFREYPKLSIEDWHKKRGLWID